MPEVKKAVQSMVPVDPENQRIISQNRWAMAVRNLQTDTTMYYDRNGNLLGSRQ